MNGAKPGLFEPHTVATAAGSPAAEAVRQLRAALLFGDSAGVRSVLVTGAAPGEAAALVATNLAVSLALDGRSVVLIDAALAGPNLHQWFECERAPGLAELCVAPPGPAAPNLRETMFPGLQVLPAGEAAVSGALVTSAVGPVIGRLRQTDAMVVVSGPPAGSSADAVSLASHVDGTVLVVQAGVTTREAGQRAKRALTQARARVLGVVLVGGAPG